jgi:hypothetical protein
MNGTLDPDIRYRGFADGPASPIRGGALARAERLQSCFRVDPGSCKGM